MYDDVQFHITACWFLRRGFLHGETTGQRSLSYKALRYIILYSYVYMGVSENNVPHFPNGFADHYPY